MGSSKSKLLIISYEDAEKRIGEKEISRLKRAFNQCSPKKTLSFDKFCSEVFGSFLPNLVADILYKGFNASNNSGGISFKELLIGLIILTKGSLEEKYKFFFSLYCNESGTGIDYSYIQYAADKTTSKDDIAAVRKYLDENFTLSLENYMEWIKEHPKFNELSRWLLTNDFQYPKITDDSVHQDIYQLVAGVTHLDELEIIELERTYHRLVFNLSNKLDLAGFTNLVSPPLPENIVAKVFETFDENNDGIIDFCELACGISACCRGPTIERKKFCCKIFNKNMDGRFNQSDIECLFRICEDAKYNETTDKSKEKNTLYTDLKNSILSSKEMIAKSYITVADLLIWICDNDFLDPFLNLMNQICMIVFGLKPKSSFEEELVITQWLQNEQKARAIPYDYLYLISRTWLNHWINSLHLNNSVKDDFIKDNALRSTHSNSKISHSISMNNVFQFNKKHQYDFTKSNKHSTRENPKDHLTGRFIFYTQFNDSEEIVHNIYPDITLMNEHANFTGSSTSISSYSSVNSLQDFSKGNKLGQIRNQCLLQSNTSKMLSNLTVLTDDGGMLSSNIKFNEDFELLPPPIWNCFQTWYGMDIAIKRPVWVENKVTNSGITDFDEHCIIFKRYQSLVKVETQLITLLIMRHSLPSHSSNMNGLSSINQFNLPAIGLSGGSFFMSSGTTYKDIQATKHKISYRASFSHKTSITELIEFLSKKLRINREEMRIWKVLEENNLNLLDDEEKSLQELGFQNFDKILVEQRNVDLTWPEELNQLVTLKALQNHKASINKGVTGLSNIGNTCFFNSAIQCISNTNILTDYFIRNIHLFEINKCNPQGCQGIVALRYGELIKDIWTGSASLIVPLKLKMTLDKYAKQFSGNQQHDAQELLSVLLDALHEDLNRIDVKPKYKKLKDSDGRRDEEVAQEAWEAHIESNLSIIVDLFHGLLKSNVSCDICKTNSVRFDAYSMLSLPIPMQLNQDFEILVFQTYSKTPSKHCVLFNTLDSTSSFICEQLAKQLSVDISAVLLAWIEDNKVKKFLNNSDKIFLTQTLYAYINEDQNLPEKNNNDKGVVSPHEHFVKFIIYHRKLIQKTNYFMATNRFSSELFGYPTILLIRKEDMIKLRYEDLHEKILQILDSQLHSGSSHIRKFNSMKVQSSISISKPNHAVDCDSISQRFPFVLSQITSNSRHCSVCHWTKFCFGCPLPSNSDIYSLIGSFKDEQYIAVDWSLTALHLSFYSDNDKKFVMDENNKNSKLTSNQPMDLIKCIESFTTQETLDIDTLYQCHKCKKPQPAHKKLDLWTLPPILIIHLKRFQFLDKRWQKSHKVVHYPFRNLDLSKFIKRDNNNNITASKEPDSSYTNAAHRAIYNLYAVNCHLGNLQMGHYVTYARNKETNKWHLFNDSMCKEVDEKDIATNCAYLLFYERSDIESNRFLDQVMSKIPSTVPQAVEIISDEVESDIKTYCVIQ